MLTLFITLLFAAQRNPAIQPIDPHWLFVRDALQWKSPPKDSGIGYNYVDNADIALFLPNGEFALVSCVLHRDRETGKISIVPNEGYILRKGTWARTARKLITVKSRLVYLSAQVKGLQIPSQEIEEHWTLHGQSKGRIAAIIRAPDRKLKKGFEAAIQSPPGNYVPLVPRLSNLKSLSNIMALSTD